MTSKIENTNYFETPLEIARSNFFDIEGLAQEYLAFNLKFLAGRINQMIILRPKA